MYLDRHSRREFGLRGVLSVAALAIGFAGGLRDPLTGLVHFGVRDYDPLVGRWVARDPVFYAGGSANLFQYVGNDPINHVDPTGMGWIQNVRTIIEIIGQILTQSPPLEPQKHEKRYSRT